MKGSGHLLKILSTSLNSLSLCCFVLSLLFQKAWWRYLKNSLQFVITALSPLKANCIFLLLGYALARITLTLNCGKIFITGNLEFQWFLDPSLGEKKKERVKITWKRDTDGRKSKWGWNNNHDLTWVFFVTTNSYCHLRRKCVLVREPVCFIYYLKE